LGPYGFWPEFSCREIIIPQIETPWYEKIRKR